MKQIKIKITGDIIALDYCTQDLPEDEDFYGNYYLTCGWNTVTGLYVNDIEDNVVKQKGKYVKTKEFFHDLFSEEGDHPLPVDCHARVYCDEEAEYNGVYIVPKVKYLYKNKKIWRINEDGTKDWIW